MKIIRVAYTPSGIQISPDSYIGYEGDFNVTQLIITPPEIPGASYYRIDWRLPDGSNHSTDTLYAVDGEITYTIMQSVTKLNGWVHGQLKAFDRNGETVTMQAGTEPIKLFVTTGNKAGEVPPEEVDAFTEMMARGDDMIDRAGAATDAANEAAASLPQYVEQAQGYAQDAEESKDGAADIYNQMQNQVGTTICPLDVNHRVPIGNMQALAMMDCIQIDSEDDLTALTPEQVQTNDIAYTVEPDGESGNYRLADSWRLLGTGDPSIRANWIRDTTAWAAQAAWALQAAVAIDTNKVNGRPQYSVTQSQYDALITAGTWDANGDYDVVPD